jgi:hypothetical protein
MFVSPVWHSLRIYHSDAAVVERTSATITLSMPEVRNGNLDFSGKPGRFDIDGYLAFAPERITWLVNQYRKDVQPGDQVSLWRARGSGASGPAGIVAECLVDKEGGCTDGDPSESSCTWTRNALPA